MAWTDFIGGIGSGFAGGGNMLNSFLHPEDAYKKSAEELFRQFEEAKKFITPYHQQGLAQYGTLQGGINSLMDPKTLISKFLESYETSPYAKQLLEKNQASGMDVASQMGLLGSSGALNNIQKGAGNIVQSDRENYLNHLMSSYLQGLGISGNIYNTGADAAKSLFGGQQQFGENMAGLRYGQEAAPGNLLQNLLRTAAMAYGGGMGGGGMGGGASAMGNAGYLG